MHNNEMETTEKLNYVPTFNNKMEDKEEWKMKMQAIQNDKNHREPCWNHPKTKHRKNTMTNKYKENRQHWSRGENQDGQYGNPGATNNVSTVIHADEYMKSSNREKWNECYTYRCGRRNSRTTSQE